MGAGIVGVDGGVGTEVGVGTGVVVDGTGEGVAGIVVCVGETVVGDGVGIIVAGGAVAVIGAVADGWTSGSLPEEQAIKATRGTRNNATDFKVIYQDFLIVNKKLPVL